MFNFIITRLGETKYTIRIPETIFQYILIFYKNITFYNTT